MKKLKKKSKAKSLRARTIMAVDASINGTAIWICDEKFKPISWFLFTTKKYVAGSAPGHTHRVVNKGYDRTLEALAIFEDLLATYFPDFIIFEDYALRASGLVFNIAEFTGTLKLAAYKYCKRRKNCHMRTVVPSVVKKWATGNGSADKEWMVDAAHGIPGKANKSLIRHRDTYAALPDDIKKQDDIADAYCIANFFMHELMIRDGRLALSDVKKMHGIKSECFFPKKKKKSKKLRVAPHLQPWLS